MPDTNELEKFILSLGPSKLKKHYHTAVVEKNFALQKIHDSERNQSDDEVDHEIIEIIDESEPPHKKQRTFGATSEPFGDIDDALVISALQNELEAMRRSQPQHPNSHTSFVSPGEQQQRTSLIGATSEPTNLGTGGIGFFSGEIDDKLVALALQNQLEAIRRSNQYLFSPINSDTSFDFSEFSPFVAPEQQRTLLTQLPPPAIQPPAQASSSGLNRNTLFVPQTPHTLFVPPPQDSALTFHPYNPTGGKKTRTKKPTLPGTGKL